MYHISMTITYNKFTDWINKSKYVFDIVQFKIGSPWLTHNNTQMYIQRNMKRSFFVNDQRIYTDHPKVYGKCHNDHIIPSLSFR